MIKFVHTQPTDDTGCIPENVIKNVPEIIIGHLVILINCYLCVANVECFNQRRGTLSQTLLATVQNFLLIIYVYCHISCILLQQGLLDCVLKLNPWQYGKKMGLNNGCRQVWVHLSAPCTHPFSHFSSIE